MSLSDASNLFVFDLLEPQLCELGVSQQVSSPPMHSLCHPLFLCQQNCQLVLYLIISKHSEGIKSSVLGSATFFMLFSLSSSSILWVAHMQGFSDFPPLHSVDSHLAGLLPTRPPQLLTPFLLCHSTPSCSWSTYTSPTHWKPRQGCILKTLPIHRHLLFFTSLLTAGTPDLLYVVLHLRWALAISLPEFVSNTCSKCVQHHIIFLIHFPVLSSI